jgi:hypothetical protein
MSPACPQQTAVVPILSGVVQKIVGELFEDFYSNEYPSAEDCESYFNKFDSCNVEYPS